MSCHKHKFTHRLHQTYHDQLHDMFRISNSLIHSVILSFILSWFIRSTIHPLSFKIETSILCPPTFPFHEHSRSQKPTSQPSLLRRATVCLRLCLCLLNPVPDLELLILQTRTLLHINRIQFPNTQPPKTPPSALFSRFHPKPL